MQCQHLHGAVLVISGSRCPLLRTDNNMSCYWDNIKQAFLGTGCVSAEGPTQCACRHVRLASAESLCVGLRCVR
jgi:hypothetical protein